MANLSRLKTSQISNGNVINADDLGAEYDQLVSGHNDQETRIANLESSSVSIGGDVYFNSIRLPNAGELTIASGSVTVTGGTHSIDTESDAATDDLDTILGTGAGKILLLSANHTDRTVVIKHNTGNILLYGEEDIELDSTNKSIMLHYVSSLSKWVQVGSSGTGSTAYEGFRTKTASYTVTTDDQSRIFKMSGTSTLTLPSASSVGEGWGIVVKVTADTTTIDPDGSETINGVSSLSCYKGTILTLVSNGTNFEATGELFTLTANHTISVAREFDFAHNMPVDPFNAKPILECITAEYGYTVGEEVDLHKQISQSTLAGTDYFGAGVQTDATNVYVQLGNNANVFYIYQKSVGTGGSYLPITNANWEIKWVLSANI